MHNSGAADHEKDRHTCKGGTIGLRTMQFQTQILNFEWQIRDLPTDSK